MDASLTIRTYPGAITWRRNLDGSYHYSSGALGGSSNRECEAQSIAARIMKHCANDELTSTIKRLEDLGWDDVVAQISTLVAERAQSSKDISTMSVAKRDTKPREWWDDDDSTPATTDDLLSALESGFGDSHTKLESIETSIDASSDHLEEINTNLTELLKEHSESNQRQFVAIADDLRACANNLDRINDEICDKSDLRALHEDLATMGRVLIGNQAILKEIRSLLIWILIAAIGMLIRLR